MSHRFLLRDPLGDVVTRDVVDGRWVPAEGKADTVVGEGLWALPGLVDAHAHLAVERLDYEPGDLEGAMRRARESLAAGVTLVLDKGWRDLTTIEVERHLPPEERPDIEAAGRIIAVDEGYFPGFAIEVGPGELGKVVATEAAAGLGWVKLIGDWPRKGRGPVANFDADDLRLAVEVAETSNARVAIHTMAREVPSLAVAAGVHSIEHGLFLTDEDIASLGARQGMWVPTIRRVKATITQLGPGSSGAKLLSEGLQNVSRLLPLAAEAGVRVLAGTDLVGSPAQVAREAIELGENGLGNREMVEAVSSAARAGTGRPRGFESGGWADAVLYPEDPVAEPEVLSHPAVVVRMGRML
ncbi:MAG: amidohydrolase family protein [Actinobacteria bacterium]|nr:amidohydrolase family protein [Actinomycetota bacterium]